MQELDYSTDNNSHQNDTDSDSYSEDELPILYLFYVIAESNNQFYQLATTRRVLKGDEVLEACLQTFEVFACQENRHALQSEVRSAELENATEIPRTKPYNNDLPYVTTCLRIGLGYLDRTELNDDHHYDPYYEPIKIIIDITKKDICYSFMRYNGWICSARDHIENLNVSVKGNYLKEFDQCRLISQKAECYIRQEMNRISTELVVELLKNKKILDLSPFALNSMEILEIISSLNRKFKSLDLSGNLYINSHDLQRILREMPEITTLYLFNTPQISLFRKLDIIKNTSIKELYDSKLFSRGLISKTTDFIKNKAIQFNQFIWWREKENYLTFPLANTFNTEDRVIEGLTYFIQNITANTSRSQAENIFRSGFAMDRSFKIYPIPANCGFQHTYLLRDINTILLLPGENKFTFSLAYIRKKTGFEVEAYDRRKQFKSVLDLLSPVKKEQVKIALEDLGLLHRKVAGQYDDNIEALVMHLSMPENRLLLEA